MDGSPSSPQLLKLRFDDGDIVIVTDPDYLAMEEPQNGLKVRPAPMERGWPRVGISDLPAIVEKLRLGTGDPAVWPSCPSFNPNRS